MYYKIRFISVIVSEIKGSVVEVEAGAGTGAGYGVVANSPQNLNALQSFK